MLNVELETTHTTLLKLSLGIMLPTNPFQDIPVILTISFERSLPFRTIVQVSPKMIRPMISRVIVYLLDRTAQSRFDEKVVSVLFPSEIKADHQWFIVFEIMETERVGIAFLHLFGEKGLESHRPYQSLDASDMGDGDDASVSSVSGGEDREIIPDSGGGKPFTSFSSSVACVRAQIEQVLQYRHNISKPDRLQQMGHFFGFSGGLV